ncbi:Glutaredoxin-like protein [Psidium guajava]|nr:Glutaredoxin-like protein [Psidium guajava]
MTSFLFVLLSFPFTGLNSSRVISCHRHDESPPMAREFLWSTELGYCNLDGLRLSLSGKVLRGVGALAATGFGGISTVNRDQRL